MARLIDADALVVRLAYYHAHSYGKAEYAYGVAAEEALKAPTIDAEPVVRCKDCKHRQDPQVCYMCFTEVVDVEGGRMYKFTDLTQPDGFCHKGAKITGKPEPSHRPEECVYYATRQRDGRAVCMGTREVDPCEGAGCKRWKPKKDGGLANG